MGSLYEIGSLTTAFIHIDRHSPRHFKDFWSIIIDTGAAVSVCPMTFCEHIAAKTMPESARRQFVTMRFIVANVQSALLGLPDIDENNVTVHTTGKHPYLEKNGEFEQLHPHGAHLHSAAMVLPGLHCRLHKHNEVKIDMAVNTRYDPNKPTTIIVGGVDDISQQANISKQLRQPPQPTKQEQEQHRITHMPYRSWCPICVKAQSVHHRRGGLKEQSLIQLDYAYTRSSIPTTCVETTTGLCMAIPTSRKGPTMMENGFGQSIIQVDNEPAIKQLAEEAARELTIPWRQSSSHTHQGQGSVE
eukprot:6218539-Amphidinium_carterae.3